MVLIPGGTITLGINSADIPHFQSIFKIDRRELFNDAVPKHTVTLEPFYMDKYLVTNAQFFAFTLAFPQWQPNKVPATLRNGSYLKHWSNGQPPTILENHPVVYVVWHSAAAYCRWQGKRLPIEAEWEHAARGGANGLFPWGDSPADPKRANFSASGLGTTTEVGKYPPNGYGLYDMGGNVWQFTADPWAPYSSQPIKQPKADRTPFSDDVRVYSQLAMPRRVIRGGSWGGAPINMWVEYRDSHPADGAQPFVGFRCAKSIE